jgi:hypothetical protein
VVGHCLCIEPVAGPGSKIESINAAAIAHKLTRSEGWGRERVISCPRSLAAWQGFHQHAQRHHATRSDSSGRHSPVEQMRFVVATQVVKTQLGGAETSLL